MIIVHSILIAAALITIGSFVNEWRIDRRQARWDRYVDQAVELAMSDTPIYERLRVERPDAIEVMSDDWPQWEAEVASNG